MYPNMIYKETLYDLNLIYKELVYTFKTMSSLMLGFALASQVGKTAHLL